MFWRQPQKRKFGGSNRQFAKLSIEDIFETTNSIDTKFKQLDFVGGPALPRSDSRWRTAACRLFEFLTELNSAAD